MRVTTNAVMRNYNAALSTSLNSLNMNREKVSDGKKFHRAYEDPTGAMRSSELARKLLKLDDYNNNVEDCIGRQDSADAVIQQLIGMVGENVKSEALHAVNGGSSEETKRTYATSFRQMQDSFIQFGNSQYRDSYLFAGANGGTPPFSKDDDGTVRYRGIDVTTGQWENGTPAEGLAELERLSREKLYVDVGTGLQVDGKKNIDGVNNIATSSDDINGASAYNKSLSGVGFLGYGNAGGTPPISKNIIKLVGDMANELESPNFSNERFSAMLDQLTETHGTMTDFNAEVGVNKKFLETTQARLKTDELNLATQYQSTAMVEPAKAIMDFNYSQYCYNLVLKVGNSLLSNSFIDFMR